MRSRMKLLLKMLMVFLSVVVGSVAQDSGLPVVASVAAAIEKCEPATDYKFFIWRRIYQPCQYLCSGEFIAFENEDDGTACSTLLVPDGQCLNGKCVDAPKTPEATGMPSTTTAVLKDRVTTAGSFSEEFETAGSTSLSDARVEDETEAKEDTTAESTTSGTADERANVVLGEAEEGDYYSAEP
uniref:Basic tail secreted protein n=1 Tax=Rhipicephalus zambeziensis TaxID=60191 RepID=A0A224YBW6_9ACAR